MKKTLYIRLLLLVGFGLAVMLVLVACEDEVSEPDDSQYGIFGEWYAAGGNIAPLFRLFPLEVDSIYMKYGTYGLNKHDTLAIIKVFSRQNDYVITNPNRPEGTTFIQRLSDYNDIWTLEIGNGRQVMNGQDHGSMGIKGIFYVDNLKNPPELHLDFVFVSWIQDHDVQPATPENGLGSSDYGEHTIHLFKKVIKP